jgi:hypothetical protein
VTATGFEPHTWLTPILGFVEVACAPLVAISMEPPLAPTADTCSLYTVVPSTVIRSAHATSDCRRQRNDLLAWPVESSTSMVARILMLSPTLTSGGVSAITVKDASPFAGGDMTTTGLPSFCTTCAFGPGVAEASCTEATAPEADAAVVPASAEEPERVARPPPMVVWGPPEVAVASVVSEPLAAVESCGPEDWLGSWELVDVAPGADVVCEAGLDTDEAWDTGFDPLAA